jgi:drug/metabolite transporter (DMT)-like permease
MMKTASDKRQFKADMLSLGAVLCWSTVATAFKLSLQYLTPAQLILYASVFAWLFLGAVLLWQGRIRSTLALFKTHKKDVLLMGFLNPALYYIILLNAYSLLPAQEAQAINYTWAITMTLLAFPMLGHRLRATDLIAALVCYAGVLIIATRGNPAGLQFASIKGVLLAFGSTVIWALYWLLNVRDKRDPVAALWMNQSAGIVMIAIYCVLTGELSGLVLSGPVLLTLGLLKWG